MSYLDEAFYAEMAQAVEELRGTKVGRLLEKASRKIEAQSMEGFRYQNRLDEKDLEIAKFKEQFAKLNGWLIRD